MKINSKLSAATIAMTAGCIGSGMAANDKPNIIFILVDDIGYECFSEYGGESYSTPRLNEFAQSGMVFEHGYASPISSATRVKLLTGMYNSRNYKSWATLPLTEKTFANSLKEQGYETAVAGKWQLSYDNTDPMTDPHTFGFDEYMLHNLCVKADKGTPRYKNGVLHHNGKELNLTDGLYGPDVVNDFVLDFIERKKDQPFLIYYPMILTHDPFQHTPDSKGYSKLKDLTTDDPKHFSDMVTYMDKLVGRTMDKLDELGIRDNTMVVFIGDNGTKKNIVSILNGKEYQGGKTSTKKAGMHVPLFVSWPKVIKGGSRNTNLIDLTDHYTTILEVAGAPAEEGLDGISYYDQLRGKKKANTRKHIFTCYFAKNKVPIKQYAFDKEYKVYSTGEFYDMQNDWQEVNNLAEGTLTEAQQAKYDKLMAVVKENMRKVKTNNNAKKKKKGQKKVNDQNKKNN